MTVATKAPKITVHRERVQYAPGSRHFTVVHVVHIGGEPFARMSSIGALTSSWRVHILDPEVWSGDFYGLADARAWALEMARRKLDPARGPIVSTKTQYQTEQRITPLDGEEE
jgi:hypothetical protein